MKMTGSELYQYSRGLRAMLDVFITAEARGVSFDEAIRVTAAWNDSTLLRMKDKAEDANPDDVFDDQDFPLPSVGL